MVTSLLLPLIIQDAKSLIYIAFGQANIQHPSAARCFIACTQLGPGIFLYTFISAANIDLN